MAKSRAITNTPIEWPIALGFILASELLGNIGSLATFSEIEGWYATLEKPWFQPPNWLFGPVWTILFALMGLALYLIWQKRNSVKSKQLRVAYNWFAIQFALNITWSFLFFGFHETYLAFLEILVLLFAILMTYRSFAVISKLAARLLLPYLAWVAFATVLNYAVSSLN